MKVKSGSEVVQLCPTLSDPMDCSLQGSSIHGIFQARVLEWGAIAFSNIPSSPQQIHFFLVLLSYNFPTLYSAPVFLPSVLLFFNAYIYVLIFCDLW